VDSGENVFFVNDPNARERFSDDYDIYNATMTYDFGAATLLSSTSYISSEKATAGLALNLGAVRTFNRDSQDNEVLTQELRLSSSGDTRLKWVVGSFYDRETLDRLQIIDLFLNGVPLGVQRLPVLNRTKSWSGFGDVSYGVTSRLDLGVGSRYFHDDRSSFNGVLYQTATFTSTDPRFYGTFALTPDIKLYANLAKGFRSGGFSGDPSGRRFQPEGIRSYELGIKGSRASGLRWELTAFYSEYEDVQAFALTSGVTGGIVNAGTAHPRGVDWLLAYDVAKLSLQASGNYTRARFSSVSPTTQTYTSGDRVDFIPEYSVAASAEYRVDWAADFPGFIRVDYNQVGPSALTDRRSGVIGFRTDTLRLFNARIGVEHGRWTGELFGNNLLDEDGVQDPLAGFGFGSRPRPRVIGVKVGATL
jgi:outer membrane receptor for ferrienterochelin and colicin